MKKVFFVIVLKIVLYNYLLSQNNSSDTSLIKTKPVAIYHSDTVIYSNKGFSGDRVLEYNGLTMNAFDTLYVGVVIYNQSDSVLVFRPLCDPGNFAPAHDSYFVTIPKGKYGKVYAYFSPDDYKYGKRILKMGVLDKKGNSHIFRIYRVKVIL